MFKTDYIGTYELLMKFTLPKVTYIQDTQATNTGVNIFFQISACFFSIVSYVQTVLVVFPLEIKFVVSCVTNIETIEPTTYILIYVFCMIVVDCFYFPDCFRCVKNGVT